MLVFPFPGVTSMASFHLIGQYVPFSWAFLLIYSIIKSCYFIDNNRCLPLLDSKYPSGTGMSYDLCICSSKHCAWIFLSRWLKKYLFNELLNDWLGFILVLLGPYSHCWRSVWPPEGWTLPQHPPHSFHLAGTETSSLRAPWNTLY